MNIWRIVLNKKKNKGSAYVFLVIVLSVIISLTFMYIGLAKQASTVGYVDGVFNLSARSVLSEYDINLKNDYGIFAFKGSERDIEEKMLYYSTYSFEEEKHIKTESIRAFTSENSMINVDVFEKEIVDYGKYALAKGIIKEYTADDGEETKDGFISSTRVLRNKRVRNALPSAEAGNTGNIIDTIRNGLGESDKAFKKGTDNYTTNRYIMSTFKNAKGGGGSGDTFFQYEVEYILEGKMSDEKNLEAFKGKLLLMRNIPNLIFIYTDPTKRAELMAAAEVASPGPGALVAQAIIAEMWALAESENDLLLLEHGKKVPIYKTTDTWAIDLQSIVAGGTSEYIDTKSTTGITYEGYLQLFLFFENKNTKLMRMMDLIQINMQGNYNGDFLIKEYNIGFKYDGKVNKRKYSYEDKY